MTIRKLLSTINDIGDELENIDIFEGHNDYYSEKFNVGLSLHRINEQYFIWLNYTNLPGTSSSMIEWKGTPHDFKELCDYIEDFTIVDLIKLVTFASKKII